MLHDGTTIVFVSPSNTIFQDKIDNTISKTEKTNRKQFPTVYILFNHRNDKNVENFAVKPALACKPAACVST